MNGKKNGSKAQTAGTMPGEAKGAQVTLAADDARRTSGGELLDMDQAIAILKTTRPTFYRWLRSGRLKGMKVGRQWRFYREDIDRFVKGQGPRIDLAADIDPLIDALRRRLSELGDKTPAFDGEGLVVAAVSLMIRLGVVMGASDIHLEPYEDGVRIRCRLDGVLHPAVTYDLRLHPAIIERWKAMAACDVRDRLRPQDGRVGLQVEGAGEPVDLRVSFMPAVLGESVTARILRREEVRLSVDRLGFLPRDCERLLHLLGAPWGAIVVTGPTGCGKTTTLYTCLAHLVRPSVKLMTIEDPVEYLIPGAVQVPLRVKEGMDFPQAVRACLRGDPDVLMVGEIRALEVLNMVLQAALTGHLVLTALHTDDAASALRRMIDVGGEPFLVADAVKLIVSQRLVRNLCPVCSVAAVPEPARLREAEELARRGGVAWDALPGKWRKHVGCERCRFTGYRGRTVIAEAMEVTPEIGAEVRRGAPAGEIRSIAVGQGMTTIAAHGILRAAIGETTLDEVFAVAPRT
jgi:type IV pilus assembly protein PilB